MKKLLLGSYLLTCLSVSTAAQAVTPPRAEPKPPAEDGKAKPEGADSAPEEAKPRASLAELDIVLVPIGRAYTRAGGGGTLRYQAPLINRPGILWDSTSINVGVREFYGFVNNSVGAFVEVTPIAFFKLGFYGGYDSLIVDPFSGGVRALTPAGVTKLENHQVKRDDPSAIDWVNDKTNTQGALGKDNLTNFNAPVAGDGLRFKIQPTLQAKLGAISAQYNFTADFNFYRAGAYKPDTIFHNTFTFTLQKLTDTLIVNELVLAYDLPISDELKVGVVGKHYRPLSTGLDNVSVNGLLFYRPHWKWLGTRVSPWLAGQAGINLLDPMHKYDFAFVTALGVDIKLL